MQGLGIGVTTKDPDSGPFPREWDDIDSSNQYWRVSIRNGRCIAWHNRQMTDLHRVLDRSAGNTFGCQVSETGELHFYHNGRDVGMAWEGLPTDQPLWGVGILDGGWKVEANYVIPKGEAVWCDVVCDVIFVSLYICAC